MKQLLKIASQTFKEIYKSKILLNTVILATAMALIVFVSSEMSFGVASRVGLDIGLGVLSLSSVGISIFMGATLLDKEIKNRTLYMIISRPVSRTTFYLGKMLGLAGILLCNVLIVSLFVLVLFFLVGGEYHYLIPWAILNIFLESLVMLFCVVFVSFFSNNILTVIFSITIYVIGHSIDSVKNTRLFEINPLLSGFVDLYSKYAINLSKLNIKKFVLYDGQIPDSFLYATLFYSILWVVIFSIFSSVLLERKDLS